MSAAGPRPERVPLLALAIAALATGLWGGLARLGWTWPAAHPGPASLHGPLMVSGFVGTVIGLERAAALGWWWAYGAPLATGLGAAALVLELPHDAGPRLLLTGSLLAGAVFATLVRRTPVLFMVTMALGTALWAVGNALWVAGWEVWRVAPWWASFLVLVIAGERLDLTRLIGLSPTGWTIFIMALAAVLGGNALSLALPDAGVRLTALGWLGIALFLGTHDLARRTIRQDGLARFMAAALLSGYVWLGVAAVLALASGATVAGPHHDAVLHALFLGFVLAMIFGHAPVIFPGVLGLPLAYRSRFWLHLIALHATLALRLGGDLLDAPAVRAWGGLLNAATVVLFLANTASAFGRLTPPARRDLGPP